MRMLEHDVPFVAAAGALKQTGDFRVGMPGQGEGRVRTGYDPKTGLLAVPRIGACFMLIRRDATLALIRRYPELHLEHEDDIPDELRPFHYAFFQVRAENGPDADRGLLLQRPAVGRRSPGARRSVDRARPHRAAGNPRQAHGPHGVLMADPAEVMVEAVFAVWSPELAAWTVQQAAMVIVQAQLDALTAADFVVMSKQDLAKAIAMFLDGSPE